MNGAENFDSLPFFMESVNRLGKGVFFGICYFYKLIDVMGLSRDVLVCSGDLRGQDGQPVG